MMEFNKELNNLFNKTKPPPVRIQHQRNQPLKSTMVEKGKERAVMAVSDVAANGIWPETVRWEVNRKDMEKANHMEVARARARARRANLDGDGVLSRAKARAMASDRRANRRARAMASLHGICPQQLPKRYQERPWMLAKGFQLHPNRALHRHRSSTLEHRLLRTS